MVRDAIRQLVKAGPFPASRDATIEQVDLYESLIKQVTRPISLDEARALLRVFGPDDFFGVAWTVLHLIETTPLTSLEYPPEDISNEWIQFLWQRRRRARFLQDDEG